MDVMESLKILWELNTPLLHLLLPPSQKDGILRFKSCPRKNENMSPRQAFRWGLKKNWLITTRRTLSIHIFFLGTTLSIHMLPAASRMGKIKK